MDYLGCDIIFFNKWLNFTKTYYVFDNDSKLHIDHFIPASKFDYKDKNSVKKAENWRNKRYLSAKDNLEKSAKLPTFDEEIKHFVLIILFEAINKIDI
mgnify:CR=1 FL=1